MKLNQQPPKPNGLHRTRLVSFPRSGHHLLVRGLQAVLGNKLIYCERYSTGHVFEVSPWTNLQKDHDFKLDTPHYEDVLPIVQIRQFLPAAQSMFRLNLQDKKCEDTEGSWQLFAREWESYYQGFMLKWVLAAFRVLRYDHLVADPVDRVLSVAKLMADKRLDPGARDRATKWAYTERVEARQYECPFSYHVSEKTKELERRAWL